MQNAHPLHTSPAQFHASITFLSLFGKAVPSAFTLPSKVHGNKKYYVSQGNL
jgi:hypothetical protein